MADITVIVLTKNEEKNITECLISAHKIAKRIIVISLVLIILLLTLLLILRIRKVIQIKETKRNIKYFPISKDKRKE